MATSCFRDVGHRRSNRPWHPWRYDRSPRQSGGTLSGDATVLRRADVVTTVCFEGRPTTRTNQSLPAVAPEARGGRPPRHDLDTDGPPFFSGSACISCRRWRFQPKFRTTFCRRRGVVAFCSHDVVGDLLRGVEAAPPNSPDAGTSGLHFRMNVRVALELVPTPCQHRGDLHQRTGCSAQAGRRSSTPMP